jgi:hypothetical protein
VYYKIDQDAKLTLITGLGIASKLSGASASQNFQYKNTAKANDRHNIPFCSCDVSALSLEPETNFTRPL